MLILYDNNINEKNYAMLLPISDTSRAEVKKKSIRTTWDVRMLNKEEPFDLDTHLANKPDIH